MGELYLTTPIMFRLAERFPHQILRADLCQCANTVPDRKYYMPWLLLVWRSHTHLCQPGTPGLGVFQWIRRALYDLV